MPIYPSVITGTKAHKHESSSGTGGPLDFDNTTLSSLNDGSMTYVNGGGGALQELTIGAAGNRLEVSGGLPVWAADPFLTAGKLEFLGKHENTLEEDTFTFTFTTPIDFADYAAIQVYYNYTEGAGGTSFNTEITLDGNTATNYHAVGQTNQAGVIAGYQSLSQGHWVIADTAINKSNQPVIGNFKITARQWSGVGTYPFIESIAYGWEYANRVFTGSKVANLGTISDISFTSSTGGGHGWEDGFFYFYGVKI